jgi:hypothetical protein
MPLGALLVPDASTAPAAGSRARSLSLLLVLLCLAAPSVRAHTITVDGNLTDWDARSWPAYSNVGHVARGPLERGEFVWRDAAGDERTDFSSPDPQADIREFRITADPTALYLCVKLEDVTTVTGNGAPMVQVAIDLDRVSGSGQSFLGGSADTQVGSEARWEFLVTTCFGSGSDPLVRDPSFTPVGTGTAAISSGTDAIEIRVPWVRLGLPGPPAQALRFTVAVFRSDVADQAWEVGDAVISDALDAVTNYMDPRTSSYPNTWLDLQDGVLDYACDLWFGPDGEPYAPLVISEVMVNPTTSGEWIEVVNRTPVTLPLERFKLGDEETPDGSERMAAFPAGATVLPAAAVTVAASAGAFGAAYAMLPSFEWTATDPAVPDMVTYLPWTAGGTIALSNSGDEVLLLDGWDTVLDVLVYGSGAYAGVVPFATAPSAGYSLERTFVSDDTDDCSADFFHVASPTPGVPGSGMTGVPPRLATRLELGPAAPNPARRGTVLALALPRAAHVRAGVFDVGGRRVRRLVDADLPAGTHTLAWDLLDDGGCRPAPGVYRVLVDVGGARLARTVVALRQGRGKNRR